MTTETTRSRIIEHLRKNRSACVAELSQALGVTKPDILYHLKYLLKEGIVEISANLVPSPRRRGRPVLHYRLSAAVFPDNLVHFAKALLRLYLSAFMDADRESALKNLARQMFSPPAKTLPITARLNQMVHTLNAHQYQARWEARAHGPQVMFYNCPYALILAGHPELCKIDAYIVETLSGSPAYQTARIGPDGQTPPACIFTLQAAAQSTQSDLLQPPA